MDTKPQKTEDTPITLPPVPQERWLRDEDCVEAPYLQAQTLRLLTNLLAHHRGGFEDQDTFAPIALWMHHDKLMELFNTATTPAIREELNRDEYHRIREPAKEMPHQLLHALWMHPKTRTPLLEALGPWLRFARETLERKAATPQDPMIQRFEELRRFFGLTDPEMDILLAGAAMKERLWPTNDLGGRSIGRTRCLKWAALLGLPLTTYLSLVSASSKLRRFQCVAGDGVLEDALHPFIVGLDDNPISSAYFKANESEPLPWSYFGELAERHGAFLKRMLTTKTPDHGLNILLYGEPGTGKTSLAISLAAEAGRTPYFVTQTNHEPRGAKGTDFRLAAIQICDGQVNPATSLIVVDEADEILAGGFGAILSKAFGGSAAAEKGTLNDILDSVRTPCIWITNTPPEALDTSNRRRFDYSVRFDKLTRTQRVAIWRNAAQKHGVETALSDALMAGFAHRYEVSAGGITLAVRNLSHMIGTDSAAAESTEQLVDRILAPHCELLGISHAKGPSVVCRDYSLEGLRLKTPIPLERIEQSMRGFLAQQTGYQPKGTDTPHMTLLLSGPPGTGKTEFVKHLGCVLDRPIVVKMGSDLLSKWVGGTEKNIKAAFHEASSQRAILFMDEFDGLLQSRNNARQSWEVTQVNELLHQIENFDGIFVAATNFSENLDAAAIRRFTFKVEFDYLDAAGKVLFFERMFGRPLDEGQRARLSAIPNLAPGDYRTARQSLFYLGDTCVTDDYLAALQAESTAKAQGRKTVGAIGF